MGCGQLGPQATTPKLPDQDGPEARLICRFPGPAVTNVANWVALDNGHLLSHSLGGQKFKIKVSAGAGPSWGPGGESDHAFLPASGGGGNPWGPLT